MACAFNRSKTFQGNYKMCCNNGDHPLPRKATRAASANDRPRPNVTSAYRIFIAKVYIINKSL